MEFSDEEQAHPVQIATLSQIIIDIKNDSETDTLNDISLEVSIPEAKVLRVWWEKAPIDLIRESEFTSKGK